MTFTWNAAIALIREAADDPRSQLDDGQRASLRWFVGRIGDHGAVLADEVGTGKTRIAIALVDAVVRAGGRAAVVVPQGLMHQWETEASRLGAKSPRVMATLNEFMRSNRTDAEWLKSRPDTSSPEWWLLSHGLRAPFVRSNSQVWRAALPTLVRLRLADEDVSTDGRTKLGKVQQVLDESRESWWGLNGMARIARDIAPKIHKLAKLRASIDGLPHLNLEKEGQDLGQFVGKGPGRMVTEDLIGHWFGAFDLLVIDEAHKSRGEALEEDDAKQRDTTVLARLIDRVIKQPEHGRRICMTATPMELELSQWQELLERARCGLDHDIGTAAIKGLEDAARRAAVAPDETVRLDELCVASRTFTQTLSPFVTRRRIDDDKLISQFAEAIAHPQGAPHPHRRLQRISVDWSSTTTDSRWIHVMFAAECMSQAARGLSNADTKNWPRAVRDAYTKLADGHVSVDLIDGSESLVVPAAGTIDEHTRGKIARVAYWYRRLREARLRVAGGVDDPNFDPDCDHPRVVAAVNEIEGWTKAGEKVLVFGVFLQPLRHLRNVLNVRNALRGANAGRPISHALAGDPALFAIAVRQAQRMHADGELDAALLSPMALRARLEQSHGAYERLRPRVRDRAAKTVDTWRRDPHLLGGVTDTEVDHALEEHLVSSVLEQFLGGDDEGSEPTLERIDALAEQFLASLRSIVDEVDDDEADAPQARLEALRSALVGDTDGRQSLHARLLQGSMKWQTRRYLQAAFNRRDASPRVLIAQSQVGREGLNLHEACRVVIQFHAEWNPAILEQQIGRVDRKGSLWTKLATDWIGVRTKLPPFVEIRQMVFEGTYDAYKWDRVSRRQHVFNASLFGSMIPLGTASRVPPTKLAALVAAAPSFSPSSDDSQTESR